MSNRQEPTLLVKSQMFFSNVLLRKNPLWKVNPSPFYVQHTRTHTFRQTATFDCEKFSVESQPIYVQHTS